MARVFVQNYRVRLYSFFNGRLTNLKKDLKTSYNAFLAGSDRRGTLFAEVPSLKKTCTMIKKILILAFAAVLMTACAFSLPGKFTQLADKVAAKGADFTPA